MSKFTKNITRILIVIIALMLVYLIFAIGYVNLSKKETEFHDKVIDTASPAEATLLDVQDVWTEGDLDATDLDATNLDAESEQTASTLDAENEQTATGLDADEPAKELPSSAAIDMELIYQHPELPTGCESVALTMVLKYYGFDLEKTTIAEDYLIYSTNFAEGYMGNPFTTGGAGIYSPGLTRTAKNYLEAQGSDLIVRNVTNSTPEKLYKYVAEGVPVIVWNTVYFLYNQPSGLIAEWSGRSYQWDNCEHCVVLTGYDLERNVVIVHDPVEGIIERDADGFWERYENLGSMAIIIR